ncbi:MAG: F0F1-type ATP synthase epsilon subunit [Candidatus Midichloriaceae bacterium]|jgi:F0F1-type ATP synthase epsilon subunit
MSITHIKFKLKTPECNIKELDCKDILFQGKNGEFQILPKHEDYVSILKTSEIHLTTATNNKKIYIVSESIIRFIQKENVCEVLSDFAISAEEIKDDDQSAIKIKLQNSLSEKEREFYKYILENYTGAK